MDWIATNFYSLDYYTETPREERRERKSKAAHPIFRPSFIDQTNKESYIIRMSIPTIVTGIIVKGLHITHF